MAAGGWVVSWSILPSAACCRSVGKENRMRSSRAGSCASCRSSADKKNRTTSSRTGSSRLPAWRSRVVRHEMARRTSQRSNSHTGMGRQNPAASARATVRRAQGRAWRMRRSRRSWLSSLVILPGPGGPPQLRKVFSAAASSAPSSPRGNRCPYTSAIIVIEAWPRRLCTSFSGNSRPPSTRRLMHHDA